jgi:hypothetical protein
MKTYGGIGYIVPPFLTLALDGNSSHSYLFPVYFTTFGDESMNAHDNEGLKNLKRSGLSLQILSEHLFWTVESLPSQKYNDFPPGRRFELRPSEYETKTCKHCSILVYTHEVGSFRILKYATA